ncbi:helix-turn-helix transcriptional regulator [Ramlibacter sp. USB13]|uniref:Shikimate kinase n=1 Tax=Ramlibacter cellulosilyticus TaxID=2764187 RepID=A0A923MTD3_9BURK|nr:helix-turn-helix transcriptional regulator [Ramlibacter cellulosilyticus]MBC5784621.1 helix-turn-helix transcriptional regulator [Ramlibacter cellulosilyticus]
MSSKIMHESGLTLGDRMRDVSEPADGPDGNGKHPFLVRLGERVRTRRNGRGMTRKELAAAAGVSERHLGNLELGVGNASVLILLQVASALKCSPADFLQDEERSIEGALIRELLANQDDATLRRVREAILPIVGGPAGAGGGPRPPRIALIGLRGAGKSTLGSMLADDLGFPFLELSREIEKFAGCTINEIQALYGQNAYRRYELRAVEETLQIYPEAVVAIPGGLVAEPATYNLVLSHFTTVWLKAHPEDHMGRVAAQGDLRPMAGNREAMEDLKGILAHRTPFYAKAEMHLDTSARPLDETFLALRAMVRNALQIEGKP